jgi:hypothetical protein
MADAGGGRTSKLKALPKNGAGGGSPPETNAEGAAAFTKDTALRNLRKEYDAYRAKKPPAKQAEIDELKILVESIRTVFLWIVMMALYHLYKLRMRRLKI